MRKSPSKAGEPTHALQGSLDKHFLACAATAAAAVGAVSTQEAQATVHYSGLLDIAIDNTTPAGIYINVDGLTTGSSGASTAGWDINLFNYNFSGGGKAVYFYGAPTVAGQPTSTLANPVGANSPFPAASKLASGASVGPASTFATPYPFTYGGNNYVAVPLLVYATSGGTYPIASPWKGGVTNGYLGFEFGISGVEYYGWARLNVANLAGGFQMTLRDFAWEDQAGAAIAAGAIPEPATAAALGMLALGAVGIRPMRRK